MSRVSLKVTGAQGQGINSVGEMCAKGLKRGGYCVYGYREYMSLIKGGHSSYQLDISNEAVESSELKVDILVCFNHHGLENNWNEVKDGGIILHQTPEWKFPEEQQKVLDDADVSVVYMPNEKILKELKAPPILGNVLITSVVWSLLGRSADNLKDLVRDQFGHKGEKLLNMNFGAIDAAVGWVEESEVGKEWQGELPAPDEKWSDHLLLIGGDAMGMGLVHAGCRLYAGYPMTPSTPILNYISSKQNETGMVVKQAEDEITAAQMMSGAMCMGTRAATASSGGGFDLMTETVSLNGIIENPSLILLAQRPGPATGLPTWTGQGDLLLAVNSAHGEFPRLVLSVSNADDGFTLMNDAFNYAERFQTPVIVLTEKQITEGIYTQKPYDLKAAKMDRGLLVTEKKELEKLVSEDRYNPEAKDGISPRWLPGSDAATFCNQGDEHNARGDVDEGAENAIAQMEKRMAKMTALKNDLPEPDLYRMENGEMKKEEGEPEFDLLIVSWGSNRSVIDDVLRHVEDSKNVGYLHYTYLWPLKTDRLASLQKKAKRSVIVECNVQSQLGMLLSQEAHISFDEKILKYDGRPFFFDELLERLSLTSS